MTVRAASGVRAAGFHFLLSLGLIAGVLMVPGDPLSAARNDATVEPNVTRYEVVVLEVEGCAYCPILRQHAVPVFLSSPQAKQATLRFVDLNGPDADRLHLTEGPVTVVPTVMLVENNREVGRASGYMGPDGFITAVREMIRLAR